MYLWNVCNDLERVKLRQVCVCFEEAEATTVDFFEGQGCHKVETSVGWRRVGGHTVVKGKNWPLSEVRNLF